MTVGAVTTPDQVNTLLASGKADLVALARPHLANPYFTLQASAWYQHMGAVLAAAVPLRPRPGVPQRAARARRAAGPAHQGAAGEPRGEGQRRQEGGLVVNRAHALAAGGAARAGCARCAARFFSRATGLPTASSAIARCALASGLAELGVGRGDVVAVQLPNIPEYLLSYAAICALGATLQPVHMPYRRAELSTLLAHSEAKVFIGLSRLSDEHPAGLKNPVSPRRAVPGALPFASSPAPPRSSGLTTARPTSASFCSTPPVRPTTRKACRTRNAAFWAMRRRRCRSWRSPAKETILSAAPLTHLYGLFAYHLSLCSGAAMSLLPAFTPPELALR